MAFNIKELVIKNELISVNTNNVKNSEPQVRKFGTSHTLRDVLDFERKEILNGNNANQGNNVNNGRDNVNANGEVIQDNNGIGIEENNENNERKGDNIYSNNKNLISLGIGSGGNLKVLSDNKTQITKDFKPPKLTKQSSVTEVKLIGFTKNKAKKKDVENFCKVCLAEDSTKENPLIYPCKCSGTMKFIHLNCLKEW